MFGGKRVLRVLIEAGCWTEMGSLQVIQRVIQRAGGISSRQVSCLFFLFVVPFFFYGLQLVFQIFVVAIEIDVVLSTSFSSRAAFMVHIVSRRQNSSLGHCCCSFCRTFNISLTAMFMMDAVFLLSQDLSYPHWHFFPHPFFCCIWTRAAFTFKVS